jgi:hypothetical protein
MRTIFRGSNPSMPVMGQPAEQVPQAMQVSGRIPDGRNGA